MPHYHLQGLTNKWQIVRETPNSAIFRGETLGGLKFSADFHFTPQSIATVSLVFVGPPENFTDGVKGDIFEDMEHIALRRGPYKMIDYSLAFADRIFDGNCETSTELRNLYIKE